MINKSIIIIILLFSTQPMDTLPDFNKIFGNDYTSAVQYLQDNKHSIFNELEGKNANPEIVIPVIFPELVRYSIFKDFFETAALELLYIDFGKSYADFSIGRFQMKPSFVEKLEYYLMKYDIDKSFWNQSSRLSDKEMRKLRVERLKSEKWQLAYMAAFYQILENRFDTIKWKSHEEKIRFYATAFNHGFDCSEEEIRSWTEMEFFPYGVNSGGTLYAYSDVSYYFYIHDFQKLKMN